MRIVTPDMIDEMDASEIDSIYAEQESEHEAALAAGGIETPRAIDSRGVMVEWSVNDTQMLLKQPPVGRPAGSWSNIGGRWVRWVFESETDTADFLATVPGALRVV